MISVWNCAKLGLGFFNFTLPSQTILKFNIFNMVFLGIRFENERISIISGIAFFSNRLNTVDDHVHKFEFDTSLQGLYRVFLLINFFVDPRKNIPDCPSMVSKQSPLLLLTSPSARNRIKPSP